MRFFRVIVCGRLRRKRCSPLCRALKWFCPDRRVINLPCLVTLIRFVNDLFVFIFLSIPPKRAKSAATIAHLVWTVKLATRPYYRPIDLQVNVFFLVRFAVPSLQVWPFCPQWFLPLSVLYHQHFRWS